VATDPLLDGEQSRLFRALGWSHAHAGIQANAVTWKLRISGGIAPVKINANERYEVMAAAFYQMHGMLAPGKDQAALAMGPSYEERQRVWSAWRTDNAEIIAALLKAVERVLGEDCE
jgi:hypothetical protein